MQIQIYNTINGGGFQLNFNQAHNRKIKREYKKRKVEPAHKGKGDPERRRRRGKAQIYNTHNKPRAHKMRFSDKQTLKHRAAVKSGNRQKVENAYYEVYKRAPERHLISERGVIEPEREKQYNIYRRSAERHRDSVLFAAYSGAYLHRRRNELYSFRGAAGHPHGGKVTRLVHRHGEKQRQNIARPVKGEHGGYHRRKQKGYIYFGSEQLKPHLHHRTVYQVLRQRRYRRIYWFRTSP